VISRQLGQFDLGANNQLLHGEETYVSGDAGYTGVDTRPEQQDREMIWSIAARPSSYKKHAKKSLIEPVDDAKTAV
jgi:IS5 family transposase